MKQRNLTRMLLRTCLGLAAAVSVTAWGQVPQAERSVQVEGQRQQVDVRQGTVVYVSGNDLVVKLLDGTVRHFVIPPDFRFQVDGRDVANKDLRPGTQLTQTITTTSTDTTVTSVRVVDAKVKMVNPPYLTGTLPDGTTKTVKVPEGTQFTVDGQTKMLSELKPGMDLKGTVVTTTPRVIVSSSTSVAGKAPSAQPAKPVDTPTYTGVLLIEEDTTVPAR